MSTIYLGKTIHSAIKFVKTAVPPPARNCIEEEQFVNGIISELQEKGKLGKKKATLGAQIQRMEEISIYLNANYLNTKGKLPNVIAVDSEYRDSTMKIDNTIPTLARNLWDVIWVERDNGWVKIKDTEVPEIVRQEVIEITVRSSYRTNELLRIKNFIDGNVRDIVKENVLLTVKIDNDLIPPNLFQAEDFNNSSYFTGDFGI